MNYLRVLLLVINQATHARDVVENTVAQNAEKSTNKLNALNLGVNNYTNINIIIILMYQLNDIYKNKNLKNRSIYLSNSKTKKFV